MRRRCIRRLLLVCVALGACSSPPHPAPPPPPPPEPGFSAATACAHLERLLEIGPRVPGTPGAEHARSYLRASLSALGVEPYEDRQLLADRGDGEPIEVVNLVAVLPGASADLFLLAAPYDTAADAAEPVRRAVAASAAALLLELARTLREEPLPYTVWIVLLGAEAPQGGVRAAQALWSSRLLAARMEEQGAFERLRLALFLDRIGGPELVVARDLRSHRVYRDAFFDAARRLGFASAFPEPPRFASLVSGHLVFAEAGVRRVVALQDPRPERAAAAPEQPDPDPCRSANLEPGGRVVRQGLDDIAALLAQVDRFAHPGPEPAAGSDATAPGERPTPDPEAASTSEDAEPASPVPRDSGA